MSSLPLNLAVERYEAAIVALEKAGNQISAEEILEVLAARAQVHDSIKPNPSLTFTSLKQVLAALRKRFSPQASARRGHLLQRVKILDRHLGRYADSISQAVSLNDWQVLLHPPEREWLSLFTPLHWRDRYDWLWQGLSIALLTASLSLLTPIASRFLEGGPDAGVFAVIVPSVLALLTGGGALTKTGRQVVENILTSLQFPKYWWDEITCLLSLLLLLVLVGFWNALPLVSTHYTESGKAAYAAGELISAKNQFQRAVNLNPNNSIAHYSLAKVYRDFRQFKDASMQYELAVRNFSLPADTALDAYNTLVQLAVRQRDYDQADFWLHECQTRLQGEQAIACRIEDLARAYVQNSKYTEATALLLTDRQQNRSFQRYGPERHYLLLTYLGRAFLGQKLPAAAEEMFQQAIALQPEDATGHCLLAQALEQRSGQSGLSEAAVSEWEQCIAYTNLGNPEEAIWFNTARQRLADRPRGSRP